jgi:transcriptional regulator with XRE-family HTH domain
MGKAGEAVARRLAETRVDRGISQRELARRSGVSFAHISRIERGERAASVPALRRLAGALDISPDWLETGDNHREREG